MGHRSWSAVSMSPQIELQVIRPRTLIRVKAEGALTVPTLQRMFQGLLRIDPEGSSDYLVDLRAGTYHLSFVDVQELIAALEAPPPPQQGRIALLDHNRRQHDTMRFFEESALRKGLDVRAFRTFEEAVDWLMTPQEQGAPVPRVS